MSATTRWHHEQPMICQPAAALSGTALSSSYDCYQALRTCVPVEASSSGIAAEFTSAAVCLTPARPPCSNHRLTQRRVHVHVHASAASAKYFMQHDARNAWRTLLYTCIQAFKLPVMLCALVPLCSERRRQRGEASLLQAINAPLLDSAAPLAVTCSAEEWNTAGDHCYTRES
jgi:hypothetical protein